MSEKDFFSDVYDVVKLVPKGRATTYGAIANYLGAKKSARMVGWAMNRAHDLKDVPAHRVVNRVGLLTGKFHFGDSEEMQRSLEEEGIKVENDQIVDFERIFWDPNEELDIVN